MMKIEYQILNITQNVFIMIFYSIFFEKNISLLMIKITQGLTLKILLFVPVVAMYLKDRFV